MRALCCRMQLWRRWYCWTALLACGLLLFGTRRGRWPFARRMVATEPFPYHMRSEERPIPFAGLVHVLHHTKMMPEDAAMMPLVRDVVKHARQEFAVDVVYDWHSTEGVAADVRDFDPESEPLLGSRLYMGVRHKSHVVRVGVHTPFAPTEVVDVEDVPVYVVISHRNRCQRLESFARNLNAMENTANLVLAVTDFNTDECDVDILLKALGLRYTANVMKLPGKFSRTLGLQLGCYSAPRQAICLMMDVDLVLPADFITRTRLVTIEHLTAYAPVCFSLYRDKPQGNYSEEHGYWRVHGFGIIALYASDFHAVGGYDIQRFTDVWGGEDSDFTQRVLQNRMLIIRPKELGYYHAWHPRADWYCDSLANRTHCLLHAHDDERFKPIETPDAFDPMTTPLMMGRRPPPTPAKPLPSPQPQPEGAAVGGLLEQIATGEKPAS